jgi:hypothetical protein
MKTFKQFLEQQVKQNFVWRVTFPKGGTTKWAPADLPFNSVQEIDDVLTDQKSDQGAITALLQSTLGLPTKPHGFEPEDYIVKKVHDNQIDIEVHYNLFHRREDGLQVAKLSIQED